MLTWHHTLGWPEDEYQIFLTGMRKVLKNKRIHGYVNLRYVYGRKPEAGKTPAV